MTLHRFAGLAATLALAGPLMTCSVRRRLERKKKRKRHQKVVVPPRVLCGNLVTIPARDVADLGYPLCRQCAARVKDDQD